MRRITLETVEGINDLFPNHLGEPVAEESQAAAAERLLAEQAGWHPCRPLPSATSSASTSKGCCSGPSATGPFCGSIS
ncbi:hypothetical protein ACFQT0_29570 [Hymenobacter humi]|uniref:Uncharacterized protein n=1 Tax=Hymenobacter humi TaxID=1411620 RepID=A0ABW2UC35_9BACT